MTIGLEKKCIMMYSNLCLNSRETVPLMGKFTIDIKSRRTLVHTVIWFYPDNIEIGEIWGVSAKLKFAIALLSDMI